MFPEWYLSDETNGKLTLDKTCQDISGGALWTACAEF